METTDAGDSGPIIEVEGLYKVFGSRVADALERLAKGATKEEILERTGCVVAIDNVSFRVRRGEVFVIMGLSGSGKSTVIRCLNRLIEPTSGSIRVSGRNLLSLGRNELLEVRRSLMSMVFQNFGLLPHRTVLRNVEYGLEVSGMDEGPRREKARQALELVGLKGYEASRPHELSGGMQQRVGLARALANDPEVLLMDEAFSALDPLIRAQMQDELLDLQHEMHKTIVFITHDLDEALKIGDRIAILGNGGKLIQIGTPESILTEPADDYVRAFVQNVDRTKVITAGAIMRKAHPINTSKDGPSVAVRRMERDGHSTIFVTDGGQRLLGLVHIDDVVKIRHERSVDTVVRREEIYTTTESTPIADLLGAAIATRYPLAVVDEAGRLKGVVDRASILAEVETDSDQPLTLQEYRDSSGSGPTSPATEEPS
jgi:glycine betaine/proline transport system ATP-binding protein